MSFEVSSEGVGLWGPVVALVVVVEAGLEESGREEVEGGRWVGLVEVVVVDGVGVQRRL